jgi:hypothetical protein
MALSINIKLDALRTEMEDKLDPTGDYAKRPTIKHGYYTLRDLKGSLPAVCFMCYAEDLEELMADDAISWIYVRIYGFAESDGIESKTDIKDLAHDVIYFLYSDDFTYSDDTWIDSNISYLEASPPSKPVGQFVFDIKIKDETTYSTLRGN